MISTTVYKAVRAEFEDHGQDLLFVIIKDGHIVKAGPYHNNSFKGRTITNSQIIVGENIKFPDGRFIKYPIVKTELLPDFPIFLEPVTVERDAEGWFGHPDLPEFDEGAYADFEEWLAEKELTLTEVYFDNDAPQDLIDTYYNSDSDVGFSGWEPTRPEGHGWFILSIHDTEDGPVCFWVRQNAGEQS